MKFNKLTLHHVKTPFRGRLINEIEIHERWSKDADGILCKSLGETTPDIEALMRLFVAAPKLLRAAEFALDRLLTLEDANEATGLDMDCRKELQTAIREAGGFGLIATFYAQVNTKRKCGKRDTFAG